MEEGTLKICLLNEYHVTVNNNAHLTIVVKSSHIEIGTTDSFTCFVAEESEIQRGTVQVHGTKTNTTSDSCLIFFSLN